MTLSDLAALGSFVSGVAVLVSLVFLWFQLRQMNEQVRQSEKNQRAQIRQAHSMRISEHFLRRVDQADLWVKVYADEPLTDVEVYQVFQTTSAVWYHIEDSYYQHRDGLLDETAGEANLTGLKYALQLPHFRAVWPFLRQSTVGSEFVSVVDKMIAETQPVSSNELIARHRASLLREIQAAQSGAPPAATEPGP
jgi:hypothetical protein